ncbi:hypothetical protein PQ478_10015 [Alkalihalophilus pseudofirmus]|uniref:hypothetical protein n=1 Tax=Alkalihalophilus pseudofirmus TaxID=79885 RepID=UPI00259B0EC8|nr:hypothetical protein [Alkalihalophilus pseudofirmus]WEG18798.1 hypothetical protein PQ478_10015 [Alkalihalophilus pseudofirmus]
MVSLKDVFYDESKTELKVELMKKESIGDSNYKVDFILSFSFGYADVSRTISWTQGDIATLKEQISNLDLQPGSGYITPQEPELTMFYVIDEHNKEEITLYITLDGGQINSQMGTETGATIKIVTTHHALKSWVNQLGKVFEA